MIWAYSIQCSMVIGTGSKPINFCMGFCNPWPFWDGILGKWDCISFLEDSCDGKIVKTCCKMQRTEMIGMGRQEDSLAFLATLAGESLGKTSDWFDAPDAPVGEGSRGSWKMVENAGQDRRGLCVLCLVISWGGFRSLISEWVSFFSHSRVGIVFSEKRHSPKQSVYNSTFCHATLAPFCDFHLSWSEFRAGNLDLSCFCSWNP